MLMTNTLPDPTNVLELLLSQGIQIQTCLTCPYRIACWANCLQNMQDARSAPEEEDS